MNEPEATVVAEALAWAEDHLFDRRSVVLEHELWLCALQRARGKSVRLEMLKGLTRERGYLRDPKNPLQLTTRPVLQREWEISTNSRSRVR